MPKGVGGGGGGGGWGGGQWLQMTGALRKIQIWLKTLILMGKSSKMAPNLEQLSPA